MKQINLIIFGIGNVGSTLIKQILEQKDNITDLQKLDIRIPLIANSTHVFFSDALTGSWSLDFEKFSEPYKFQDIIDFLQSNDFQHTIAIDATASTNFVKHYAQLIEAGCHIVSANKVANTLDIEFYKKLRKKLKEHNRLFLYETNVGAGLPIVETVQNLHRSGEKIKKIRGVFSGSLSYIFNKFSESEAPFSDIVGQATEKGYTEPDARDDLSGKDVARKLLILARELGLTLNLQDVDVESLVPSNLNGKTTLNEFKARISELDEPFKQKKQSQTNDVLRYVGELDVKTKQLKVELVSTSKASPLGQLQGADNIFEVYSETYTERPLILQGAGAGKETTARGLFTDILKISKQIAHA
ncbi:aspartate kinase [Winogradskyella maritima]|uniref:homoserine dehydrogenase n=1 Tax=Winogradskyella maritima TaxID=1517766 RepID=A0ABV8AD46_9FLAO|nr:aspartate kinase [Winogradskyella maritima]